MKEQKSRLMVQLEQEKKKLQEDIAVLKVCVSQLRRRVSLMVICRQEKESNLALGEDLNINMPFQLCGNLSVRLSVCLSVCSK